MRVGIGREDERPLALGIESDLGDRGVDAEVVPLLPAFDGGRGQPRVRSSTVVSPLMVEA